MIAHPIPHDPPRRDLTSSYKLRSKFWLVSVCAHILWVAVVVHIPLSAPASRRPIFDQFIRPLQSKVLIYRPKKTAQATPETRVGQTPDPRGKIVAPRTTIATSPKADSQKQIVWNPVKPPEIKVDVPAPTIVARVQTAPPPPAKAAPKLFTPPELVQKQPKLATAEIKATLSSAPAIAASAPNSPTPSNTALPPPPKVAPKQFTPPPASQREPKLAIRTEINTTLTAAAPVAVAPTGLAVGTAAPAPLPKIAPKQFTPPPGSQRQPNQPAQTEINAALTAAAPATAAPNGIAVGAANAAPLPKIAPKQFTPPAVAGRNPQQATSNAGEIVAALPQAVVGASPSIATTATSRLPGPPAPVPTRGNEQVNLASASVNPVPGAQVPTDSRTGQFSVAPVAGEPSSGTPGKDALSVPNLTVREPAPPKLPPAKSNTVIYAEKVRTGNSASATFTVPLRPANRSIPRALDARFAGRPVYALVIPIENLPAYGGDWILWFAEITPQAGQTPTVRAPVPERKIELVERARETTDTRLQIAATIGVDGRLSNLKVLSTVTAAVQAIALEDLASWEWRPATRNGTPIPIEAVFEIPFRLGIRP